MSDRYQTALIAGERISYTVRRSRRAKHVLLHVDVTGQVEVVIPWRVRWTEAERFVRAKEGWIHRHRRRHQQFHRTLSFSDGSVLPFLGEQLQLHVRRVSQQRRPSLVRRENILFLRLPATGSARTVVARWYRRQAAAYFSERAKVFAEQLGVTVQAVRVGNHKTQWGSCTPAGRLAFNWRLLLGPPWVADYVVAHEVAHLVHLNHSRRYWATVAQIYPHHRRARRWLRTWAGQLVW